MHRRACTHARASSDVYGVCTACTQALDQAVGKHRKELAAADAIRQSEAAEVGALEHAPHARASIHVHVHPLMRQHVPGTGGRARGEAGGRGGGATRGDDALARAGGAGASMHPPRPRASSHVYGMCMACAHEQVELERRHELQRTLQKQMEAEALAVTSSLAGEYASLPDCMLMNADCGHQLACRGV